MRLGIGVAAILVGVACLRSGADGQHVLGANWLSGLTSGLDALNRNIQDNVQQLNQRITESVNTEVAQVRRLTDDLNKGIADGTIRTNGGGTIVNGNNIFVSDGRGTKTVQSGRTSDGTEYVRELSESTVGDTLRHVVKIYYPKANVTKIYGFTLDLKDIAAKPVPIAK